MQSGYSQKLLDHVDELIAVARSVVNANNFAYHDFYDCQLGASNVARLLGPDAMRWASTFDTAQADYAGACAILGGLQSLRRALCAALLCSVEVLIHGEVFDDLLEQAEYLFEKKYFLAAGVLGRAVLEENLRQWCVRKNCVPTNPKATMNDFKDALYAAKDLDKMNMKHVEAMAAIGNEAAHNGPSLTEAKVERLLRDVRTFVTQNRN